ncbi:MAG: CBS domain-containing protein [Anaerolineae bacterium]
MFVRHRMTSPAVTISPDMPAMDALQYMKEKGIRRLPVVNDDGRLLGIVSEKDLLHAAPSDATTLSIFEVTYLLNRLTVGRVMTRDVITVTEDTPLERAARIMAERHLGGLPVLREGRVIGIITETDLLLGFSEALGAFESGVRVMLEAPDEPGVLASIANRIQSLGGNVVTFVVFRSGREGIGYVLAKVQGVKQGALADALNDGRVTVLDVREMGEHDLR